MVHVHHSGHTGTGAGQLQYISILHVFGKRFYRTQSSFGRDVAYFQHTIFPHIVVQPLFKATIVSTSTHRKDEGVPCRRRDWQRLVQART